MHNPNGSTSDVRWLGLIRRRFLAHATLFRVLVVILIALVELPRASTVADAAITFNDSSPDQMTVTTPSYTASFSKANGALLAITGPSGSTPLTTGSAFQCLWGVNYDVAVDTQGDKSIAGCFFSPGAANGFTYSWNAGTSQLTLSYTGSTVPVDATAIIQFSSTFFDMSLHVQNHAGATVTGVTWPFDLQLRSSAAQAAYLPYYLPGLRLNAPYFAHVQNIWEPYPSATNFADYIALDTSGGRLALYTVNPLPNPIAPSEVGFFHDASSSACNDPFFCIRHLFDTWVPGGGSWSSPVVRIRVDETAQQSMTDYRVDNQIDKYPSVSAKLGTKFSDVAQAVLLKADPKNFDLPFRQWNDALKAVPTPLLLHPVGYTTHGFDRDNPDFLSIDPSWGTVSDFHDAVQALQARHILVMPYTNPTWWNPASSTVQGLDPAAISVQSTPGVPLQESYASGPGGSLNSGYVVSPSSPVVQQTLDQRMKQWQTDVPVDCVFEDQIGSRSSIRDFNPTEPNPYAYNDGWLAHAQRYAAQCLMTENGWDRLADAEAGFAGSALTWETLSKTISNTWGAGTWDPYPLAGWLFHDKTITYQHDLAPESMDMSREPLVWDVAFGNSLTYDWEASNLDSPWLQFDAALQRAVLSHDVGQPLTSYDEPAAGVSHSVFAGVEVYANRNPSQSFSVNGTTLPPLGFLATTTDGTGVGGIVSGQFDGQPLTSGDHSLVIEREQDGIIVRQPMGADTPLTLDLPAGPGPQVHVGAYDASGKLIAEVPFTTAQPKVTFTYQAEVNGHPVSFYRIWTSATSTATPTPTVKKCKKNATRKHGQCVCKKGYKLVNGKCKKK